MRHPAPWHRSGTAWGVILAAALLGLGCGSSTAAAAHPEQTQAEVEHRLAGSWRLVRFEPEQPLSAPFQALLDYQIQVMVIRFGEGRIVAEAPGINFDRRYEVKSAEGRRFRAVSYDEGGVPYDAQCQWSEDGQKLEVYVETSPWRGLGLLQRL